MAERDVDVGYGGLLEAGGSYFEPKRTRFELAEQGVAERIGLRFLLHIGVNGGKLQARPGDHGTGWVSYFDGEVAGDRLCG